MKRNPNTSTIFFFNDTATTEIYTLSLHDALPISKFLAPLKNEDAPSAQQPADLTKRPADVLAMPKKDRKSTRLNSSHSQISYAVFCLKKKKKSDPTVILSCQAITER